MNRHPTQWEDKRTKDLRSQVTLLNTHLGVQRTKLSATLPELVQYCEKHAVHDPFLFPIRDNPFKPIRRPCCII